jgi:hypothetical protein
MVKHVTTHRTMPNSADMGPAAMEVK